MDRRGSELSERSERIRAIGVDQSYWGAIRAIGLDRSDRSDRSDRRYLSYRSGSELLEVSEWIGVIRAIGVDQSVSE